MCGISAIYRYTHISEEDKQKLTAMNREMEYRGPDENGVWSDDTCGLAHTRLSIIGLENGKQPLFNEDRSLVLICNGEIYNYIELKQILEAKGHRFRSDSDSETILHLYEEYGVKCLEHLRGMFAFCLWNTTTRQLFVARDRIGEKTLYYSQLPTGFVFCTELKAILKHYLPCPQLKFDTLAEPIRYNYPIGTKDTYIEQVKKLKPGHYALVDASGIKIQPYWKRNFDTFFEGNFRRAKSDCLQILRESIKMCLRSDVPVAVLLSGGIDSSAIAALAKEEGKEVHAITAGYKGQHDSDERFVARRFAKETGLIYHEIELDEQDFKDNFEEYTHYIDEPVCDVASMAQWALYKKAKSLGFTVLLAGNGGDELFYGYPYENAQAEALQSSHAHQSFFPLKGSANRIMFFQFIFSHWENILSAKYKKAYNSKYIQNWTYNDYSDFAQNAFIDFQHQRHAFKDLNLSLSLDGNNLPEIDLIYQKKYETFLTNLSLYLADRLGMGNAVELRSPFIDYKLIEFVSSLPLSMRYKQNEPKFLLKEMLKGILPDYILSAQKRGFTPPFEYINAIEKRYHYKVIEHTHGFFNTMLADRLLYLNLYKNV